MHGDEARTMLSFINIGVEFKENNLSNQGDLMSQLKGKK